MVNGSTDTYPASSESTISGCRCRRRFGGSIHAVVGRFWPFRTSSFSLGVRAGWVEGPPVHVDYLSNHPRERLDELTDEQARLRSYRNRRIQYCRQLETELRETGRRKSMVKRLFNISNQGERELRDRIGEAERQVADVDRQLERLGHDVEAQRAGVHGEESFVATLRLLCPDDDVTLLCGYRNRKGEVDGVLITPSGVWLIEVKNRNIQLDVDGTRWNASEVDSWGNIKGRYPAADSTGRSWARQVLEPARDLQRRLSRKGLDVPVHTAVMMVHDRASINGVENPEVDLVSTRPEVLIDAITSAPPVLFDGQLRAVIELIRRDHRHHESKRRKVGPGDVVVLGGGPQAAAPADSSWNGSQ